MSTASESQHLLKPFGLTLVLYDSKNKLLSLPLALLGLIPIAILHSLATLIIYNRELESMMLLLSLVLQEGVNYILKHTFKHPRPIPRHEASMFSFRLVFLLCKSFCLLYP